MGAVERRAALAAEPPEGAINGEGARASPATPAPAIVMVVSFECDPRTNAHTV